MFNPNAAILAIETFDSEEGFLKDSAVVIDGAVRLAPAIRYVASGVTFFPPIDWELDDDMFPESDVKSGAQWDINEVDRVYTNTEYRWEFSRSSIPSWLIVDGRADTNIPYDGVEVYLDNTGEWTNVDNSTGWGVELKLFVPTPPGTKPEFPMSDINSQFSYTSDIESRTRQFAAGYEYSPLENQLSVLFDDGTIAFRIYFGVFHTVLVLDVDKSFQEAIDDGSAIFLYEPMIPSSYILYPRTIRVSVKEDDITITVSDGIGGSMTRAGGLDKFTSPLSMEKEVFEGDKDRVAIDDLLYDEESSKTKEQRGLLAPRNWSYKGTGLSFSASSSKNLRIGRTGGEVRKYSYCLLGNVRIRSTAGEHDGMLSKLFTLGEHATFTPAHRPIKPLSQWVEARYIASHYTDGGNTRITPYYRHSDDPWATGETLYITGDITVADLSSFPVTGDTLDEIRFRIIQEAASPFIEAPRIEEIQLVREFNTTDFGMFPSYAPRAGGKEVDFIISSSEIFGTGDPVFVDNVQVPTGDVTFVNTKQLRVRMPSHEAGYAAVRVGTGTLYPHTGFYYHDQYDLDIDDSLGEVFSDCRSPFSLMTTVPKHGVNIGFVQTRAISPIDNVQLSDFSGLEPANRVGYTDEITAITNDTTGEMTFENMPTDEILITNQVAWWNNLKAPTPLFYKYLVGRGEIYLFSNQAGEENLIEAIRSAIVIKAADDGDEEFVYDVRVSTLDFYGESLPKRFFSVVILTNKIPDKTMWVEYLGAKASEGYASITQVREIINPVSVFGYDTDEEGNVIFEYDENAAISAEVVL